MYSTRENKSSRLSPKEKGEKSKMNKYRLKQPHERFGKSDTMPWHRNAVNKWHSGVLHTKKKYLDHTVKRIVYSPTIPQNNNYYTPNGKKVKVVHVNLTDNNEEDNNNSYDRNSYNERKQRTTSPIIMSNKKNVNYYQKKINRKSNNRIIYNSSTQNSIKIPTDLIPPRISFKMDKLSNRIDTLLNTLHKRETQRVFKMKQIEDSSYYK